MAVASNLKARKKASGAASPPLPTSTPPLDGPPPEPPALDGPPPEPPALDGPPPDTPAALGCRQPVILRQPSRPRCAEVAGGTAAECTAVCCCCPCMLVNLLVLASVRLPVGLCRRAHQAHAKRRERARMRKEAKLLAAKTRGDGEAASTAAATEEERGLNVPEDKIQGSPGADLGEGRPGAEVAEMEKAMLAQFHNTGFWRSPSQRERR